MIIYSFVANAQINCDISGPDTVCLGDFSQHLLTLNPPIPYHSIEWNSMGGSIISSDSNGVEVLWQNSGDDRLTADVLDDSGQLIVHCTANVFVLQDYDFIIDTDSSGCDGYEQTPNQKNFCEGRDIVYFLRGDALPPDATYHWYLKTNNGSITLGTDGFPTMQVHHLTAGEDTLCVEVVVDGCEMMACILLTTESAPQALFEISPDNSLSEICVDQTLYFVNKSSFNPQCSEFLWEVIQNDTVIENSTKVDYQRSFHQPGTYTIRLSEFSCCHCPVSIYEREIIVLPNEGIDIECPSVVCFGDTVTYTASPGCDHYEWMVYGGTIVSSSENMVTIVWDANGVETGWVQVIPTGCPGNVCLSPTTKKVPIIQPNPKIIGRDVICGLSRVSYSTNTVAGGVYSWHIEVIEGSRDSMTIDTSINGVIVIRFHGFSGKFIIYLNVYHVFAGCSGADTLNVEYIDYKLSLMSPNKLCYGEDVDIKVLPAGNYLLDWELTKDGQTIRSGQSQGDHILLDKQNFVEPGEYDLYVNIDGEMRCSSHINIRIDPKIKSIMDVEGPDPVCLNEPYEYSVNDPPYPKTKLIWFPDTGCILIPSSPVFGNYAIVNWTSTQQRRLGVVRSDLSMQCFSDTTWISPELEDTIPPSITGPDTVCMGQIANYTANKGEYIHWSVDPPNMGVVIRGQDSLEADIEFGMTDPGQKFFTVTIIMESEVCGVSYLVTKEVVLYHGEAPIIAGPTDLCINQQTSFEVQVNGQSLNAAAFVWNMGDGHPDTTTTTNLLSYAYSKSGNYFISVSVEDPQVCITPNTAIIRVFVDSILRPTITADWSCLCTPENCECSSPGNNIMASVEECECTNVNFIASRFNSGTGPYEWEVTENGFTHTYTTDDNVLTLYHTLGSTCDKSYDLLNTDVRVKYLGLACGEWSYALRIPECDDQPPKMPCSTDLELRIVTLSYHCNTVDFRGRIEPLTDAKDPAWGISDPYNTQPIITNTGRRIEINDFQGLNESHTFTRPGIYSVTLGAFGIDNNTGDTNCIKRDLRHIRIPVIADFLYEIQCTDTDSFLITLIDRSEFIDDLEFLWEESGHVLLGKGARYSFKMKANDWKRITLTVNDSSGVFQCDKTKDITTPPQLLPGFTTDKAFCMGSTVSFTPLTNQHPVVDYYWDFGDGTVSTDVHPMHHYPEGLDTVTVRVSMKSIYGCTVHFDSTIALEPNTLELNITKQNKSCTPKLFASVNGNAGSGDYSYEWSNGAQESFINPKTNGVYSVTVTDNVTGCQAEAEILVKDIQKVFFSEIEGPDTLCKGTSGIYRIITSDKSKLIWYQDNTQVAKATDQIYLRPTSGSTDSIELTVFYTNDTCDVVSKTIYLDTNSVEVQQEVISCDPFKVRLYEVNGKDVEWKDVFPVEPPSSEIILKGKHDPIKYRATEGKCRNYIILVPHQPIDFTPYLTGCYDVCESDVMAGHVILNRMIRGRFETWSYINGYGQILLSGTGIIKDLPITMDMLDSTGRIKVYLELSKDYDGVVCTKRSEPFCLIVDPCNDCSDVTADISLQRDLLCETDALSRYVIEGDIVPVPGYELCTTDGISLTGGSWAGTPEISYNFGRYHIRGVGQSQSVACADSMEVVVWLCPAGGAGGDRCRVSTKIGCSTQIGECQIDAHVFVCNQYGTSSTLILDVELPLEWVAKDDVCFPGCTNGWAEVKLIDPSNGNELYLEQGPTGFVIQDNQRTYQPRFHINRSEWDSLPPCIEVVIDVYCDGILINSCSKEFCYLNPWLDGSFSNFGELQTWCQESNAGYVEYGFSLPLQDIDPQVHVQVVDAPNGLFTIEGMTGDQLTGTYRSASPELGLEVYLATDHPELPGGGKGYCLMDSLPSCTGYAMFSSGSSESSHAASASTSHPPALPRSSVGSLELSPNPVREKLHLRYRLDRGAIRSPLRLTVRRIDGRHILPSLNLPPSWRGVLELDTGGWPSGIYFVELSSEDKTLYLLRRFVKL